MQSSLIMLRTLRILWGRTLLFKNWTTQCFLSHDHHTLSCRWISVRRTLLSGLLETKSISNGSNKPWRRGIDEISRWPICDVPSCILGDVTFLPDDCTPWSTLSVRTPCVCLCHLTNRLIILCDVPIGIATSTWLLPQIFKIQYPLFLKRAINLQIWTL